MHRLLWSGCLFMSSALLVTFSAPQVCSAQGNGPTIVDVVVTLNQRFGEFDALIAALQKANLVDTLAGPGPFTVFAPTDNAFSRLESELGTTLDQIDVETLTQVLLLHVADGRNTASTLKQQRTLTMKNGQQLQFRRISRGRILITDPNGRTSRVIIGNLPVSNGIIYVIDTVLLPGSGEAAAASSARPTSARPRQAPSSRPRPSRR